MKKNKINLILIQIDEAHSSAWPIGLKNQVLPQKDFKDRIERAQKFVKEENVPFEVLIDTWENDFANKYKAWPDKYYCLDNKMNIIAKSEYGENSDALINKDCCVLINELLNK